MTYQTTPQTPAQGSLQNVPKGRSFAFVFDRNGQDIAGYICTINVQRFPGDTPAITRTIEPDHNKWSGFLTSTETAALDPAGTWMLIAAITNASDDKAEYQTIRFAISEAL